MRRNIGQPRTLLPLSRSWFKGTLLEAHWPYRRGQVNPPVPDRSPRDRTWPRRGTGQRRFPPVGTVP
ncbi:hypothetical protein DM49_3075 [Burkholderia mallei]|nr:hypothetical protein DM49_3075 [Burkholderia mallei]